jgi:hypothetical protein
MTKTAFTKMGNLGLSLQRVARHTNAGVGHLIFMKAKRPLPNLTLRKSWKRYAQPRSLVEKAFFFTCQLSQTSPEIQASCFVTLIGKLTGPFQLSTW